MDLKEIGYFSKTHGVKGQLILRTENELTTDDLKALFIDMAGAKAPYFISEIKETGSFIIVGLEDIDTIEKAKKLIGKKVSVDSQFVVEEEAEEDWTGYEIVDKELGSLGTVSGTSDNGQQVLLSIIYKGREVLLPFVDDFIERIDESKKTIFFNAPAGLIDVYLNDSDEEE